LAALPTAERELKIERAKEKQKAALDGTQHAPFGTGENECYTPVKFLDAAREVLGGFGLDPASSDMAQRVVKAAHYFTEATNGLAQEWRARSVWLNPPYGRMLMTRFVAKLLDELQADRTSSAILLCHTYSDTAWWQSAYARADAVCFPRGRIRFVNPEGVPTTSAWGHTFFYFGPDREKFVTKFSLFGCTSDLKRHGTRGQEKRGRDQLLARTLEPEGLLIRRTPDPPTGEMGASAGAVQRSPHRDRAKTRPRAALGRWDPFHGEPLPFRHEGTPKSI
jgi:phage N-6-adenine-methyltransferase